MCFLSAMFMEPKVYTIKPTACLWLYLILLLTSCAAFDTQRIKEAETERDSVYQSLYVPANVVLLREVKRSGLLDYNSHCVSASAIAVYGTNRPLREIIEEYHEVLIASDWELSPWYKQKKTDSFAFYQYGSKTRLFITDEVTISLPTPTSSEQQFRIIYSVFIHYEDPSIADCIP